MAEWDGMKNPKVQVYKVEDLHRGWLVSSGTLPYGNL